jgi:hypothetical protein
MVMSTKEHSLLVEKYRSKDLTEYVGNEHIKTQIQKYLDQDDIQNFILLKLLEIKSHLFQVLPRLKRLKLLSLMKRIFLPSKHKRL